MVGHHKKTFLAQTKAFCFHGRRRHFVGLACAHFVCKQRITAIKHMGDGVALVFSEGDLRVHAHKFDVASVILTGSGAVKQLVVLLYQRNAPLGGLPDPVGKSVFDDLLFLLCQHGLPLVQHTLGLALGILNGVVDADIFQVQGLLQNLIGIGTGCAVGFGRDNIAPPGGSFAFHTPLGGVRRISHLDRMAQIVGNLESLGHKFLNDFRRKPCGTQPHINFRCFQFSGLRLGQRIHIDGKFRVGLCRELCHPQLCPDIAGKVLVCHLPACFRVGGVGGRVFEDHAGQFGGNAPVLAGCAQQFCHIGQIHFAMLPDGYRQCFAGGIYACDGALRANRPFREHRCLGFKLSLLVQIFQRAEQIIGGILLKQPPIFTVIQQAVLCGKGIVGGVQLCLCRFNILVRVVVQLLVNQFVDNLAQFHHAGNAPLGGVGQFHLRHHGIFPVENFAVHYGIGEVLDLRVGRQGAPGGFFFGNVGIIHLGGGVLPLDVLHRFCKLVGKADALKGRNRQFLSSILGAFGGEYAQNHLRVVHKILVDGKVIFGLAKLHPCGFDVRRAVTLLQEDNVRNDICTGVGSERIVGQTDSAQQVCTFCHVFAGGAVLTVHGVAAGDERHHTARTHLVNGLGEKVVVDRKSQLVVRLVVDFILTKRYVAHG